MQEIVYYELLIENQTTTDEFCYNQFRCLESSTGKTMSIFSKEKLILFQHENVRHNTTRIIKDFLEKHAWEIMIHPSYSSVFVLTSVLNFAKLFRWN